MEELVAQRLADPITRAVQAHLDDRRRQAELIAHLLQWHIVTERERARHAADGRREVVCMVARVEPREGARVKPVERVLDLPRAGT